MARSRVKQVTARQRVIAVKLLVGMGEIAVRAGVQRGTVLMWRQRYPHFPPPLLELNLGPVWNWLDVDAWLHRYRRRRHPSKS